jgi:hypothetical protein
LRIVLIDLNGNVVRLAVGRGLAEMNAIEVRATIARRLKKPCI